MSQAAHFPYGLGVRVDVLARNYRHDGIDAAGQVLPLQPSHWWWSVLNDGVAYIAWKHPNYSENGPDVDGASALDFVGLQRHMGGANYVFADGHAKWMKPEATLRPRQSTSPTGNLWTWDKDTFKEFK